MHNLLFIQQTTPSSQPPGLQLFSNTTFVENNPYNFLTTTHINSFVKSYPYNPHAYNYLNIQSLLNNPFGTINCVQPLLYNLPSFLPPPLVRQNRFYKGMYGGGWWCWDKQCATASLCVLLLDGLVSCGEFILVFEGILGGCYLVLATNIFE